MSVRIDCPATGPKDAKIVIVGEQPGSTEVVTRQPFTGPAGRVLNECLQHAGISRDSLYITNVIKTVERPISHYYHDRRKTFTEYARPYLDLLHDELMGLTNPYVIIPAGNVALAAVCARSGITKWHGSIIEAVIPPGCKAVPIIHPATVIPPKNVYLNRYLIIKDLIRAREQAEFKEIRRKERELHVAPTYNEIISFLRMIKQAGLNGFTIDFDIECDIKTLEVTCIAFACDSAEAMSIPFEGPRGPYMTPEQEAEVWLRIADILEDPRIAKRGQNLTFDIHFLLRRYGIRTRGEIHDTMVAQKILMPDFPVGLDFITYEWTDLPYYKDEGKKWIANKVGGWESFWTYNATDVIVTAEAGPKQLRYLESQGNLETYDRQRRLIPPLVYMMERGTKVDVEGMTRYRQQVEEEIKQLEAELEALAGRPLNYNSPKQLIQYFYHEQKAQPYRKRKTGSVTVDAMALKRLARKGFKEASIIQRLRYLTTKVLGTYADLSKLSADGRYRCSYNPVGTETGRLSSSQSIFGEGGNQQNWPHELLTYLIPDDGYLYCSFDLSQAENRIVAYVGRVTEMIEAFESGEDIHSLTASLIFGEPIEQIKAENAAGLPCDLGDGKHTKRFWGKKANHGLNYGLGFKTFALYYEIPETQARWIVDRYHRAYPGVREGYHRVVQSMLYNNRTLVNLRGRKRLFLDRLDDRTFKEAYAHIPQSSVADIINEWGIEYIYYSDDPDLRPIELLNQIHDSIGFQIPLSVGPLAIARALNKVKRSLEQPLQWGDITFRIPVDLTIGFTLNKEYAAKSAELSHKKWPKTDEELADWIAAEVRRMQKEDSDA